MRVTEHYKNAKEGQWTYVEASGFEIIDCPVFRKGGIHDVVQRDDSSSPVLEEVVSADWLMEVSEWVSFNTPVIEKFLDIINHHEATSAEG